MVVTRPYHPKNDHSQVLARRLTDVNDPLTSAVNDLQADVGTLNWSKVLHELGDVMADERCRVIGRAMSNADRPGDTFDLLLGRYSA